MLNAINAQVSHMRAQEDAVSTGKGGSDRERSSGDKVGQSETKVRADHGVEDIGGHFSSDITVAPVAYGATYSVGICISLSPSLLLSFVRSRPDRRRR